MSKHIFIIYLVLVVCQTALAFMVQTPFTTRYPSRLRDVGTYENDRAAKSLKASNKDQSRNEGDLQPNIQPTFKINDHGSDLTDRFKYKVHALMGNFDPLAADKDNEHTDGNILNAFLEFPASYVFNVVGKTNGSKDIEDSFVNNVKQIIESNSGDKDCVLYAKPRGSNFTKVVVEATVQSAGMITSIYDQLADLEQTVMRF